MRRIGIKIEKNKNKEPRLKTSLLSMILAFSSKKIKYKNDQLI
ncbi:hypothetical protein HJ01_01977 [Flavobacterium frigoris PS1]|uniref:Uncharacterized protein n=1 Tax=Flavobacterium frigoris (strain PS1) TaxID=1086011 RepID=H7FSH9_FLAFP|nr:hypothetical protein HJ01_01977 [Flavobacterium frigoris PS1]